MCEHNAIVMPVFFRYCVGYALPFFWLYVRAVKPEQWLDRYLETWRQPAQRYEAVVAYVRCKPFTRLPAGDCAARRD